MLPHDLEEPRGRLTEEMGNAEVVVLCHDEPILEVSQARDVRVGHRGAAVVLLDVPRVVTTLGQERRQRLGKLLVDEERGHAPMRCSRAEESSAANSSTARMSSRSSSS